MITIRQEHNNDHARVYEVVKTAFATAEHSDGTEHDLVERLRKSEAFIPELSLVALEGDDIVGHIMFTKLDLGGIPGLALAPLAILPEHQRRGIGSLLIGEGHRIARDLGYEVSVVVGSEHYYPRMGYQPASGFGIRSPFELPDVNYMAFSLQGRPISLDDVVAGFAKEFFE